MNKIKQNKITFILVLSAIAIIFSSLTVLSLPVLFNYKSKVAIIEKNFYKNFKIYLNSSGIISYKPFPKPHLVVENASLILPNPQKKSNFINTSNLRIYISLRDIYLRSFNNFISTEISKSNLKIRISDLKEFRKHLYQKVNKPIIFQDCKIFLKNEQNEVILISPIKKISYKINNKTKFKILKIDGHIFGLKFKSDWRRGYDNPNISYHDINFFNPNIEIKNIFEFTNGESFKGVSKILSSQAKMEHKISYNKNRIYIRSLNNEITNFNIDGQIQLKPFYFESSFIIKNKKVEKIIDNILPKLLIYNEDYLGNLNGLFKVNFKDLDNKLIKNGKFNFIIKEKKIDIKNVKFELDKIGNIESKINFFEDQGEMIFTSKNQLNIDNHIEFAKAFQVGSKKIKNIKKIFFDLEKKIGETNFTIKNVKIYSLEKKKNLNEVFFIKNIQNLRSHIRKIID